MKTKLTLLLLLLIMVSCETKQTESHEYSVEEQFNNLKSPVILIGKEQTFGMWGITVKDSAGTVKSFGNMTAIGNNIGASRKIGDTIK